MNPLPGVINENMNGALKSSVHVCGCRDKFNPMDTLIDTLA